MDGELLHLQRPAEGQDPGWGDSGWHAIQAPEHQPHRGGRSRCQRRHSKDLRPVGTTRPVRLPRGKAASMIERLAGRRDVDGLIHCSRQLYLALRLSFHRFRHLIVV